MKEREILIKYMSEPSQRAGQKKKWVAEDYQWHWKGLLVIRSQRLTQLNQLKKMVGYVKETEYL